MESGLGGKKEVLSCDFKWGDQERCLMLRYYFLWLLLSEHPPPKCLHEFLRIQVSTQILSLRETFPDPQMTSGHF